MGCADSKAVVEPNRDKTLVSTNDQNVPIIYENVNIEEVVEIEEVVTVNVEVKQVIEVNVEVEQAVEVNVEVEQAFEANVDVAVVAA